MNKIILAVFGLLISLSAMGAIKHEPFGPIKIGERANVAAKHISNQKIAQARLYFKSNLSTTFSHVELNLTQRLLHATLPAPGQSMSQIEYFFAIKYQNKKFEKSPVYGLNISNEWLPEAILPRPRG